MNMISQANKKPVLELFIISDLFELEYQLKHYNCIDTDSSAKKLETSLMKNLIAF
jgi:hypothetical protein